MATCLLRWISAELYFSLGLQAARDMFEKGYSSLSQIEKIAVDNWVAGVVRANYQSMTPELLAPPSPVAETPKGKQPVGFQDPNPKAQS